MNTLPENLLYTSSHEWVKKQNDNTFIVGITSHAQDLLGDIVFVDLPSNETAVTQGDETAVVESVKTAADIYAPLSGTIIDTNSDLDNSPELINTDPYDKGWIYRISINDATQLSKLLTAQDYLSSLED